MKSVRSSVKPVRALASTLVLQRLDLRGQGSNFATLLPAPNSGGQGPVDTVAEIVADVRQHGDEALVRLTQKFDGVALDEVHVEKAEMQAALATISPVLREALEVTATRIDAFHRHQLATMANPSSYRDDIGLVIDTIFRPVRAAACYVPGGRAVYPSTVLHTAIPARVAQVERIVVCVPPGDDGNVPAATLAACAIANVDEVIKVGGAQVIAAVAFGTESIAPVDVIVGPGNIYVALAKRMVDGAVGVPSAFAGPSEVVVVADTSSPAELVAIDLLVQAEHGPLGLAWCVTWDEAVADAVDAQVKLQAAQAARRDDIEATLGMNGYMVLCDSPDQAMDVVNHVAPEHLELMVEDPTTLVEKTTNAGAVFCGTSTPASLGDYLAGPSHVLPTHRSARYGEALGVRDFLKEMHVVTASEDAIATLASPLAVLAEAEGLYCHAESAVKRTLS